MDFIQNQVLKIVSSIQEVIVITFFFECVKKENNDMISNIKNLREETNYLISDLKADSLNVELDNINKYEHGDDLVVSQE